MMISFTSSILLGLTALSTTIVSNTQAYQVQNEIKLEKNNGITNVEWHNNNLALSDNDKEIFTTYEFSTNLSFWSSSEHLYKIDGDYAYLEYLDLNNNWITLVDLLDSNLPTDRKNQKYFEFDFIEGTYGIRFIAHKENPITNRNK